MPTENECLAHVAYAQIFCLAFSKNWPLSWYRCYDFKNIFAKKFRENIGVIASNYS
jgi:hypothetical protein